MKFWPDLLHRECIFKILGDGEAIINSMMFTKAHLCSKTTSNILLNLESDLLIYYKIPYPLKNCPNIICTSKNTFKNKNADNTWQIGTDTFNMKYYKYILFIYGSIINATDSGKINIIPYLNNDSAPAIIVCSGLKKRYKNSIAHSVNGLPAIECEYLHAIWHESHGDVTSVRKIGPKEITIKNYQEYWKNGQYLNKTWEHELSLWNRKQAGNPEKSKFIQNSQTDITAYKFFIDELDEFIYMAQYSGH